MISHVIIYAIVFVAGLYNAVMDKLKDHFSSSIWWNKIPFWQTQQDANGKKFLGMVWDAWHVFKTAWIYLMIINIWVVSYFKIDVKWWEIFCMYLTHGLGFNLGYKWLFKRK